MFTTFHQSLPIAAFTVLAGLLYSAATATRMTLRRHSRIARPSPPRPVTGPAWPTRRWRLTNEFPASRARSKVSAPTR